MKVKCKESFELGGMFIADVIEQIAKRILTEDNFSELECEVGKSLMHLRDRLPTNTVGWRLGTIVFSELSVETGDDK